MVHNNTGEAKNIKRGAPLLHRYILEERRINEGYMYGLRMGWVWSRPDWQMCPSDNRHRNGRRS